VRRHEFSASVYASLANRSLPPKVLAERAENATIRVTLHAREEDAFVDDDYYRGGKMVLLGHEGQALAAFTTRYLVDMSYPDGDCSVDSDGSGYQEWREHDLTVYDDKERGTTYRLRALSPSTDAAQIRFPNARTAYYRTFDDNDVVIVYFPPGSHVLFREGTGGRSLGLSRPTEFLERLIAEKTNVLGLQFVLLSPESLNRLRQCADVQGILSEQTVMMAAALVAAVYVLPSLGLDVGAIALDSFGLDTAIANALALGNVSGFWADALPIAAKLAGTWLLDGGHLSFLGTGGELVVELMLAEMPDPRSKAGKAIEQIISTWVGDDDLKISSFGQDAGGPRRALVFDPEARININFELVAQGLVKLDLSNEAALDLFPEFIDAAERALVTGAGHAAEWRQDLAYIDGLRAARAKRTKWLGK
jgi:hypothetical protein